MADLSTQLRNVIESEADPVTVEEIFNASPASLRPSTGATRGGRHVRWWAAAAAVVAVIAGAVALVDAYGEPPPAADSPLSILPIDADSYPAPGACGGSRMGKGLQFAGAESADVCIGVASVDSDATTVVVTSSDGERIFGGWVLDGCGNALSASQQVELGNDSSPVLKMGAVPTNVTAVQYRFSDGTLRTAQTAEIPGVTDRRFYAIIVPANAPIADEVFLASDGIEVAPPIQRCPPPQQFLPDDVIAPLVASYIAESSAMMSGIQVGDPCTTGRPTATPPMSTLVDGRVNTPECIVIGWVPNTELPGIPMGYYGQDGTILWSRSDADERPPASLDLRQMAIEWASTH